MLKERLYKLTEEELENLIEKKELEIKKTESNILKKRILLEELS